MTRSTKNYILLIVLFVYTIVYKLYIFDTYMKYAEIINASFLIVLTTLAILFLGYRKDQKTYLKRNIFRKVIIILAVSFMLMYGYGFFNSFLANAYSLKLPIMLDNICAPFILAIVTEIFRYVYISANKDKKGIIVLMTMMIIFFELMYSFRRLNFDTFSDSFYTLSKNVIPLIVKNCMLSYLSYNVGMRSPILYRLIMDLYYYVMPIIPDLGKYLETLVSILIPSAILVISFCVIDEYHHGVENDFDDGEFHIIDIPLYLTLVIVICLKSGFFPHTIMGIGSDSMSPYMVKGDAVIVEEVKEENLNVGDIIVYKTDEQTIVHRLVEIQENEDEKIYKAKGDANNAVDSVDIKYENIKGIVKLKIPYLGYPTIWLSNLKDKK